MGQLTLTRRPGQRIFLSASSEADAAELLRQLSTDGIWVEVDFHDRVGQLLVRIVAPPALAVVREELLG